MTKAFRHCSYHKSGCIGVRSVQVNSNPIPVTSLLAAESLFDNNIKKLSARAVFISTYYLLDTQKAGIGSGGSVEDDNLHRYKPKK